MKKVIVLGTAHSHVVAFANTAKKSDNLSLLGVWDDDMQSSGLVAEKVGTATIASLDDALVQKPDLVLIGAVPCDRADLAIKAVKAGAAVLTDKPIAVTHEALDNMIEAVKQAGKPIIAAYPYRGEPMVRAAKAALDAGRIGKLVRIGSYGPHRLRGASPRPDWHFTRKHNGGALIDVGSHHVDLCCWFANQTPDQVSAQQVNISQPQHAEFQDFVHMMMHFPAGQLGYVEADWLNPESIKHFGDTRIWVQGTQGKIELRFSDTASAHIWTHEQPQTDLDTTGYEGGGTWTAQLLEDLAHGQPCAIDQSDIWRASRVTLCGFDSAVAGGKPVAVKQ